MRYAMSRNDLHALIRLADYGGLPEVKTLRLDELAEGRWLLSHARADVLCKVILRRLSCGARHAGLRVLPIRSKQAGGAWVHPVVCAAAETVREEWPRRERQGIFIAQGIQTSRASKERPDWE